MKIFHWDRATIKSKFLKNWNGGKILEAVPIPKKNNDDKICPPVSVLL